MTDRLTAFYRIETAYPLAEAAAVLAGEQSTGTFARVPGETDTLRARHAARIEAIEPLEDVAEPSLPGAGVPAGAPAIYRRALVTVSWPIDNMGPSLPNVLATVAGNLYELKPFSGLRLEDLRLPPAFLEVYDGPQFGVAGTRRLAGVAAGPIVGTIIKPSVGMSPAETAATVEQLVAGGIDFIKDDELQADGPHCPFEARVAAVMKVVNGHADRTGKQVMVAFNLTGEVDEMRRRHDAVLAAGGTCVMVSLNSVGLAGLLALRRSAALPIHGHRNGWGAVSRHPALGFSYPAWSKLFRLAGADHLHVNGLRNKFCEPDASVIASARDCLTPMFDAPGRGCEAVPVFSSGQSAGQAADTYRALGSTDLIYACGGGIAAHPDGIAAGVRAIREAWQAAEAGIAAENYAKDHPALARALAHFGR